MSIFELNTDTRMAHPLCIVNQLRALVQIQVNPPSLLTYRPGHLIYIVSLNTLCGSFGRGKAIYTRVFRKRDEHEVMDNIHVRRGGTRPDTNPAGDL